MNTFSDEETEGKFLNSNLNYFIEHLLFLNHHSRYSC